MKDKKSEKNKKNEKYAYKTSLGPVEFTIEQGFAEEAIDFRTHAISVPCQVGCPAGTDIPGYIEKISQGKHDEAYAINLEDNVMPGVLGRICVRPCQTECRHNWTDINGTVEICSLKRSAADRKNVTVAIPEAYFEGTGKQVAVIGGGPSGLAAARELKRFGHTVTLYEKESQLGGMLVDGIPRYRLPLDVIEEEVNRIIDSGIEVVNECVTQEHIKQLVQKQDAVVIATGTTLSKSLELEGIDVKDTYSGLEFMKAYNHKEIKKLTGDIVIIGGGFTAVDSARSCARAARKLKGAEGNVTIVYRRSLEYMAADQKELDEMEEESVQIKTLLTPIRGIKDNGKLSAVVFQKNYLKQNHTTEKPDIIPVENGFVTIPCNHLIIAIGQKADFTILPEGISIISNYKTTAPNVFAIGDFFTGSLDVIHSIADGKNIAEQIDIYLMGTQRRRKGVKIEKAHDNGENNRRRAHDVQRPIAMGTIPVVKRAVNNKEVQQGFDDDQTNLHANRCYFCHYKFQINQDLCIHCNWCIDVTPRNCIKKVTKFDYDENGAISAVIEAKTDEEASFIWIDSEQCIRCGKCHRTCPTKAIEMVKSTLTFENRVYKQKN